MATLVHKWPFTEQIGTTAEDVVGDNMDMTFIVDGDYPKWLTTEPGIEFDGSDPPAPLGLCYTGDYLNCASREGPIAYSLWVNMQGAVASNKRARPMLTVFDQGYGTYEYSDFQDTLYIDTSGRPCFGGSFLNVFTRYNVGVTGTTSLWEGSDWHFILGYLTWSSGAGGVLKIYVDGLLENTATTTLGRGTSLAGICIGAAYIWDYYVAQNLPGTTSDSNGAFDGAIKDVRVYCGTLTDDDVWDIYNENKTVANAIMFSCNT
jgi:hypothetical protein